MQSNYNNADPFWGCEESSLPEPDGLAAKWYQLKAQTGNNHPGPVLPFGMVSVLPYSGAYPTGYGRNDANCYGRPPHIFKDNLCRGFTHFHVSGTGAIRKYYNYFRFSPLTGDRNPDELYPLVHEKAVPGFYEAELGNTGIHVQLTVGKKSAYHRYSFTRSKPALALDLLQCGILAEHARIFEASISRRDQGLYDAYVQYDIPLYACIRVLSPEVSCSIIHNGRICENSEISGDLRDHTFRLMIEANTGTNLEIQISFSLRSAEQAYENLRLEEKSFHQATADAVNVWKEYLGRIEIETTDSHLQKIFASAYYHSCIKPSNFENESPFWSLRRDCYLDFATLWDQYKTQLPLIFTLYPEISSGIVNSLLNVGEYCGEFPNSVLMSSNFSLESKQAISLAVYSIVDAYWRKIPDVDWERALMVIDMDLTVKSQHLEHTAVMTHYLDFSEACLSAAEMAHDLGNQDLTHKFLEFSKWGKAAYDPVTGLLNKSIFYEGHIKTYSFRLMHSMQKRISLYPSREKLQNDLDSFFGFTSDPVPQNYSDISLSENNRRADYYQRFEAVHNEPDMETPYFYLYLNQHDRTVQIIHDVFRYMFSTGRGGLSGNNDSGSLSSWYVWNAMGLFPVAGQNLILIGTPALEKIGIHLSSGNDLTVIAENFAPDNIYVHQVRFNGTPIARKWLTVKEMMAGGTLTLKMSPQPNGFEDLTLPPECRLELEKD